MASERAAAPAARPTALGRALQLALVAAVAGGAAWLTWPRPDVHIVVERDGRAHLRTRGGQVALPETLRVASSGDGARIRVTNRTATAQQLGIFGVAPGAEQEFRIRQPGTYGGFCSAHPSRQLVFLVR